MHAERNMRTLLAFFLVSVSLQYGYLYAVDSDDVEEISDNAEDDDELDDEDEEDESIDSEVKETKNVKLKIANNNTALSANLGQVERVKDNKKDIEKDGEKVKKNATKKVDLQKELKDRAAQVTSVSGSINDTIKELEVHMNNKRFDARNRSFFRKLYAEFSAIADYMGEFKKRDADADIILAYINIAVDDIYFITSDENTVGISDVVKQTISEILFKTADGKIVLEWLKEISSIKMNID